MILRRWQSDAVERYMVGDRYDQDSFLAYVTPGGGKTIFALTVANRLLEMGRIQNVVVVVHTTNLREQWIDEEIGFEISDEIDVESVGYIVTYQQLQNELLSEFSEFCESNDVLVIFDEIHHAGESKAWGEAIKTSFISAKRKLLLSGTPFRRDDLKIPFVEYPDGVARADFEYGYAAALNDGVVPPVYFPTYDGKAAWKFGDEEYFQDFDSAKTKTDQQRHLNTLIDSDAWLVKVLDDADCRLSEMRKYHKNAAGLVVAKDQVHARRICEILDGEPVLAISDLPDAHDRIERFRDSDDRWIVSVRMVTEGISMKRFRIGVYATNYRTELFFRQLVGRLARIDETLLDNSVCLYLPSNKDLMTFATELAESRLHAIKEINRTSGTGSKAVNKLIMGATSLVNGSTVLMPGSQFSEAELEHAKAIRSQAGYDFLQLEMVAYLLRINSRQVGAIE